MQATAGTFATRQSLQAMSGPPNQHPAGLYHTSSPHTSQPATPYSHAPSAAMTGMPTPGSLAWSQSMRSPHHAMGLSQYSQPQAAGPQHHDDIMALLGASPNAAGSQPLAHLGRGPGALPGPSPRSSMQHDIHQGMPRASHARAVASFRPSDSTHQKGDTADQDPLQNFHSVLGLTPSGEETRVDDAWGLPLGKPRARPPTSADQPISRPHPSPHQSGYPFALNGAQSNATNPHPFAFPPPHTLHQDNQQHSGSQGIRAAQDHLSRQLSREPPRMGSIMPWGNEPHVSLDQSAVQASRPPALSDSIALAKQQISQKRGSGQASSSGSMRSQISSPDMGTRSSLSGGRSSQPAGYPPQSGSRQVGSTPTSGQQPTSSGFDMMYTSGAPTAIQAAQAMAVAAVSARAAPEAADRPMLRPPAAEILHPQRTSHWMTAGAPASHASPANFEPNAVFSLPALHLDNRPLQLDRALNPEMARSTGPRAVSSSDKAVHQSGPYIAASASFRPASEEAIERHHPSGGHQQGTLQFSQPFSAAVLAAPLASTAGGLAASAPTLPPASTSPKTNEPDVGEQTSVQGSLAPYTAAHAGNSSEAAPAAQVEAAAASAEAPFITQPTLGASSAADIPRDPSRSRESIPAAHDAPTSAATPLAAHTSEPASLAVPAHLGEADRPQSSLMPSIQDLGDQSDLMQPTALDADPLGRAQETSGDGVSHPVQQQPCPRTHPVPDAGQSSQAASSMLSANGSDKPSQPSQQAPTLSQNNHAAANSVAHRHVDNADGPSGDQPSRQQSALASEPAAPAEALSSVKMSAIAGPHGAAVRGAYEMGPALAGQVAPEPPSQMHPQPPFGQQMEQSGLGVIPSEGHPAASIAQPPMSTAPAREPLDGWQVQQAGRAASITEPPMTVSAQEVLGGQQMQQSGPEGATLESEFAASSAQPPISAVSAQEALGGQQMQSGPEGNPTERHFAASLAQPAESGASAPQPLEQQQVQHDPEGKPIEGHAAASIAPLAGSGASARSVQMSNARQQLHQQPQGNAQDLDPEGAHMLPPVPALVSQPAQGAVRSPHAPPHHHMQQQQGDAKNESLQGTPLPPPDAELIGQPAQSTAAPMPHLQPDQPMQQQQLQQQLMGTLQPTEHQQRPAPPIRHTSHAPTGVTHSGASQQTQAHPQQIVPSLPSTAHAPSELAPLQTLPQSQAHQPTPSLPQQSRPLQTQRFTSENGPTGAANLGASQAAFATPPAPQQPTVHDPAITAEPTAVPTQQGRMSEYPDSAGQQQQAFPSPAQQPQASQGGPASLAVRAGQAGESGYPHGAGQQVTHLPTHQAQADQGGPAAAAVHDAPAGTSGHPHPVGLQQQHQGRPAASTESGVQQAPAQTGPAGLPSAPTQSHPQQQPHQGDPAGPPAALSNSHPQQAPAQGGPAGLPAAPTHPHLQQQQQHQGDHAGPPAALTHPHPQQQPVQGGPVGLPATPTHPHLQQQQQHQGGPAGPPAALTHSHLQQQPAQGGPAGLPATPTHPHLQQQSAQGHPAAPTHPSHHPLLQQQPAAGPSHLFPAIRINLPLQQPTPGEPIYD